MGTARGTGGPHIRHHAARDGAGASATRLNSSFSLILRPADFGDEPRDDPRPDTSLDPELASPRQSRSQSLSTQLRGSVKREPSELPGNPFVADPQSHPNPNDQSRFRQDIYPAYDANGRRIGLDHMRGASNMSESNGHYRKHVHEYDNARGAPLPFPSQVPAQSNYPDQGPLPPVSAVIAGIPADSQYGIGSFSYIQNRPRTPHEVLGLPPGAPLNLWSLPDPDTPEAKPQYNYHVLVKLAILGNKGQKATLQDILRAIRLRFPYYANLPKQEAIAFSNSIRHLLSLLAAFVREPKPVTEPGKGSYWKVDFSKGEGNKRIRKRNKPQKRGVDRPVAGKGCTHTDNEKSDNRSESEDSQAYTSTKTETPIESPTSRSPIEDRPQTPRPRGGGKGGRKPAPKNLINTPSGGTTTVPVSTGGAGQDDLHARIDPALIGDAARNSDPISHANSASDPSMQAPSGVIGPHRGRITRGAARNPPYPSPSPLIVPGSASSNSSSSERGYQRISVSPVDMRYHNGSQTIAQLSTREMPASFRDQHQQSQQGVHRTNAYGGPGNSAYIQQPMLNANERFDSVSPQSPLSDQSILSPAANTQSHLAPGSSYHSSHFIRSTTTPSAGATYNITCPLPAPSSALSNNVAYGFAQYAERQNANSVNPMPASTSRSRVPSRQNEPYTNFVSWNPPQSVKPK